MVYRSAPAVNLAFRGRHDVLLDAANPGNILGRGAEGPLLFFGAVVGHPEMHDPIPDDDIGRPGVNPLLPLQLGQEFLADRAVVGGGVGAEATSRRRQRPYKVGAADDADQLPVSENRHPLDPFGLQQICYIGEFGGLTDGGDLARHDISGGTAMRFDVGAGEFLVRSDRVEPPRAPAPGSPIGPAIGSHLDAMQQIALADDPDEPILRIDHRNPADAPLGQDFRYLLYRSIRTDGDHIGCHHVHSAHWGNLPLILPFTRTLYHARWKREDLTRSRRSLEPRRASPGGRGR